MQDLLLAQKRDRPAYCFQHLDLELRSNCDPLAKAVKRAPPGQAVVARFRAEWNSVEVNKTRSFNILRPMRPGQCTVLLQFGDSRLNPRARDAKSPGRAAPNPPRS